MNKGIEKENTGVICAVIPTEELSRKLIGKDEKPFYEVIQAGAFANILSRQAGAKSIKLLLNHDKEQEIKNSNEYRLELFEGEKGLNIKIELDLKDYIQNSLYEEFKRNPLKIKGFSFGFIVGETAEIFKNGVKFRTVKNFKALNEISILTKGKAAYAGTENYIEIRNAEGENKMILEVQGKSYIKPGVNTTEKEYKNELESYINKFDNSIFKGIEIVTDLKSGVHERTIFNTEDSEVFNENRVIEITANGAKKF